MRAAERIVVFQTAFIGDVVLTTSLIQVLRRQLSDALIDVVAIPAGAAVLRGHPDIHDIIVYDKRGVASGVLGIVSMIQRLRSNQYTTAVIPHRSLRSGLICFLAGIPRRIGFSTSAARRLMTDVVAYRSDQHETVRDMSLLHPLGVVPPDRELPRVYPSHADEEAVSAFMTVSGVSPAESIIAIAPGSVWATKRWLPDRFAMLAQKLAADGHRIVLIGGKADKELAETIGERVDQGKVVDAVGELTLLQSAELIRRSRVLISNDSAPMHLAVAVGTPVVAIFGATVPEFGFAPMGEHDVVVQTLGLKCRPCSIHGGNACPIKTFVCMKEITAQDVLLRVNEVLAISRIEA
ncbi:MAG: lipopolysaccharide heptosyltransferase II [Ignavibacteriae bacterium]|nr:lipopolysaccharide heptosyltransferase II [Ignavibacteriota bacterium]